MLAGLARGEPFTVEWARETVPAAYWTQPLFLRINAVISLAWGAAFAALTLMSLPGRRRTWRRRALAVAVVVAAGAFTAWYPSHARPAP